MHLGWILDNQYILSLIIWGNINLLFLTFIEHSYILFVKIKEQVLILMSSVREAAIRQYVRQLDGAAQLLAGLSQPKDGWIATMRKALGMSAPELARRTGVTKPAIYQAERKERAGGISIQHMEKLAEAMGGRFVYAIVPENTVNDVLQSQAREKAEQTVKRASAHMALEKQSLTPKQIEDEIERLAEELLRDRPSDFWEAS